MYTIYSNINCPACVGLKQRLTEWGIPHKIIYVNKDPKARALMAEHGFRSVPQLALDGNFINNPTEVTKEDLLA